MRQNCSYMSAVLIRSVYGDQISHMKTVDIVLTDPKLKRSLPCTVQDRKVTRSCVLCRYRNKCEEISGVQYGIVPYNLIVKCTVQDFN